MHVAERVKLRAAAAKRRVAAAVQEQAGKATGGVTLLIFEEE
eukprot:SAG11_NODE_5251_length_1615_cov_1.875989_3_plen_41_part_01